MRSSEIVKIVFDGIRQLGRLEAQTVQARVDLDVHRSTNLALASRVGELAHELAGVPEGEVDLGRHRIVQSLRRDGPEHENGSGNPALAQGDGLFDGIDADAPRERLRRRGNFNQAVTVRVRLHDEGGVPRAHHVGQRLGVAANGRQGDAEPAEHHRPRSPRQSPAPALAVSGRPPPTGKRSAFSGTPLGLHSPVDSANMARLALLR